MSEPLPWEQKLIELLGPDAVRFHSLLEMEERVAELKRAVAFYDQTKTDPEGYEVGAVKDGWDWILAAVRKVVAC